MIWSGGWELVFQAEWLVTICFKTLCIQLWEFRKLIWQRAMIKSRSWKTFSKKGLIVNILGFADHVVLVTANWTLPSVASTNTATGNPSTVGPGCAPVLPVGCGVLNPAEECRLWDRAGWWTPESTPGVWKRASSIKAASLGLVSLRFR